MTTNKIKFNVLQTFYNNEIGLLLSGFLKSGEINLDDKLKWHTKKNIYDIKIISIHGSNNYNNNNISLDKIKGPLIATLCVKSIMLILIKK